MHNAYGEQLDSNGYAPTIMPHEPPHCYRCGFWKTDTARHEIYGGSRRTASKQLGLWVNVCPACHDRIHASGAETDELHKAGQLRAMQVYHWTAAEFRQRFGKNYLDTEEQ